MSRAKTVTLLSLDRYAELLGLDPLHFAGGYSTVRPTNSACHDVWAQWSWQNPGQAAREEIARKIAEAEREIAQTLGYWPAPRWIVDERQPFPQIYRPDMAGDGMRQRQTLIQSTTTFQRRKSAKTKWGYVQYGGQRTADLLDDDPIAYTTLDADGDGFAELAVFTIAGVSATLDVCEVEAYFKVYDVADTDNTRTDPSSSGADERWQVRPIQATLSGTTLTVYIKRWYLFKPQLQEAMDWDDAGINADLATVYVDELLFYRVYNDPETQVSFLWGEDADACVDESCAWATQAGCMRVTNKRVGLIVPQPATYADDAFTTAVWAQCVEPDMMRLWYRAGWLPETSYGCVELEHEWAWTIAMLATARLDWPLCTCGQAQTIVREWRENAAMQNEKRTYTFMPQDLSNPFGTRVGEIMAWKRTNKVGHRKGKAILA